jgi:hypothetical protein
MKFKNLRTEYLIIISFVLIKTIIHLVADSNSGFDGDEVLYIDSGNHLAAGYMEAPPCIGILAFLQNLFHSKSIYVNHIFVHLASAGILFLCGLITIKLGGKWRAVLLTMLCITFAPAFGITHNSFQPVIFDQFFWVLGFYFLVNYCIETQNKYLVFMSGALALGFLAKYSIAFLVAGIIISFVIWKPQIFKNKIFWLSVLVFLLIVSLNIAWQIRNNFPVLDHFTALHKLIAKETFIGNAGQFLLTLNPFAIPVWVAGIFLILISKEFKSFRLFFYSLIISFFLLIAAKGRFYYAFPIVLGCFCTGSIYLERYLASRKWIFISYVLVLAITGIVLTPFSLPVVPLNQYIKLTGLKMRDDGRIPLRFEARYTRNDWKRLTEAVADSYQKLSPQEKKNCLILGSDYTQTGVLNMFGENYGLPEAISFHGSYFTWIPEFSKGITMIAIGNTHLIDEYPIWTRNYQQLFDSVEVKSHVFCPYARDDVNACFHIFVCRGIKYDSRDYKIINRNRIFE